MASTSKNFDTAPASYYPAGGQQHQHDHQQHHPDQHHIMMMKNEQKSLGIPPGWRFRPTDQELITEYLIKKILKRPLPMNSRFVDVNLYGCTPMDLAAKCQLPEDPIMFFFTPREKKYPNGARPSRTTSAEDKGTGYWKATGTNYVIKCNKGKTIGYRMTLVFYQGQHKDTVNGKTNWIMQEYTTTKGKAATRTTKVPVPGDKKLDEWVLCKVYQNTRNKRKKYTDSVDDDEEETNSLAGRSHAEEDQNHPLLHNPLPAPTNGINNVNPSTSNLAEQYNMMINNRNVHAVNNGSTSGAHQEVEILAQMSHAQQQLPIPLSHSTNISDQGGQFFNGITPFDHQRSTQYGFAAQSMPIYNNASPLDNQFRLEHPLPDFDFSSDDIGEFLDFGTPYEYAEPLNYVPHIEPATPSTKAEVNTTSTPTDDH